MTISLTILLCSLTGLVFGIAGYVMGSRRVRVSDPEALARYARQSGENAARAVS